MWKYFDKLARLFIVLLPFNVLISVFFQFKLWLPFVSFFKEFFIMALGWILVYEYIRTKKIPKFWVIDYVLFWYLWYLIIISILNNVWIKAFIYWGRYDFEFLLAFLIFRHWFYLLENKLSYYMRLFIYSGWIAILVWILIRFVIWENILVYLWFSPKLSVWSLGGSVPIYHWIEWANVRRFQWIFDWPNQAAFFILTYLWILIHYFKNKKEYYTYLFLALFVLLWLIFMTYSRSSLIWIVWGFILIVFLNIKTIFKKYKKETVGFFIFLLAVWWIFYLKYWNSFWNIVLRAWSSKWHYERMIIWFDQFRANPLWRWLASSWPAYRSTHNAVWVDEKNFIPESWFIQQLVEWWIIGFILFTLLMYLIFVNLYSVSFPLSWIFAWVLVMNVFLHTFEAVYISLILFVFIWMFLNSSKPDFIFLSKKNKWK
ncbi:MAG: hypothetical protein ACD_4C00480G0006 [uncultured bacterium (gcode 4)]|uniref:O-antigen polymerase n=1 Tax=uncultured bacterium (gcode 4) TaxID=1234023 RepID=K2FSX4_9BACT|nr:MAG: hypothetical protein ACD_4C00480G0006 [uncultured bacterium (gcode 4)]